MQTDLAHVESQNHQDNILPNVAASQEVAGQATNIFEAIPSSIGEDATSGQPDATINSNRQQPDMQTHDVSASLMKASEPGSQTQNNSIEMPTTRM